MMKMMVCEVYFDGIEGPYSVVEGDCSRRRMIK
jgi:hypothetical protein